MSVELVRLDGPDGDLVRLLDDGRVLGEVRPRGAQVTRWCPARGDDVVFAGARHQDAQDRVLHGGVPVCFPWFATGPRGDLRPAHGPARLVVWRELRSEVVDRTLTSRWSLERDDLQGADGERHVPAAFRAVLVAELGPTAMHVTLEVANPGDEEITVEMALHTYLRVGDVSRVRLQGLDGARYLDKVASAEQGVPVHAVQEGELRIEGEVDRVHASSATVLVDDPVMGRSLEVSKEGSASTVVWNPAEKGSAYDDLAEGEWREYVCVEAANAGDDAVTIEPGGSCRMTQGVRVR